MIFFFLIKKDEYIYPDFFLSIIPNIRSNNLTVRTETNNLLKEVILKITELNVIQELYNYLFKLLQGIFLIK